MNIEYDTAYEPAPEIVISDVETLRALSDQLRLQLLELLAAAPRTAKELATALHLPSNKLYYHLNMLEERGLVRVVQTRVVSGIIEKTYRAVAHGVRIDRGLFAPNDVESVDALMATVFDSARTHFQAAFRAGLMAPPIPPIPPVPPIPPLPAIRTLPPLPAKSAAPLPPLSPLPSAVAETPVPLPLDLPLLPERVKLGRATTRLTSEQFQTLCAQVDALMVAFSQQPPDDTASDYELLVALFPTVPQT